MRRWPLLLALACLVGTIGGCADQRSTPPGGDEPASRDGSSPPPSSSSGGEQRDGVVGHVTAGDGTPLEGCSVTADPTSFPAPAVPEKAVITDADGRYYWSLPPATYTITAYCPRDEGTGQRTGEVTDLAVTEGEEHTADITVR
ncbi:carboxypeptidase family protein [Haloactinospora alba]|uniref:Carboxypeptidase family protein n=1 Tax=Haloactinospora alba TaxID=405555 RepID=A0A543NM97_9ACTN|nr:carboxypeptidase-like regulatory domain-containing protein [Haloactinospora alba]TQN32943.1 carboxypeptidase family protein [Haloactinospora alba]